jgi:hypothetical protein
MDRKDEESRRSDYLVLLAALRHTVSDRWAQDRMRVRAELMRLITVIEHDMPRNVYHQSAFEVARSLVVLGQPLYALHRIELQIFEILGQRTGSSPIRVHSRPERSEQFSSTPADRQPMNDNQNPSYMAVGLKDTPGYFVLVTWPDGFETQVHGFADEAQALAWIGKNGSKWRTWAPQRVPRV